MGNSSPCRCVLAVATALPSPRRTPRMPFLPQRSNISNPTACTPPVNGTPKRCGISFPAMSSPLVTPVWTSLRNRCAKKVLSPCWCTPS
ncbi:unnamed protein product [Chondrus crispus]|uniref:Uncharacterized protein n=1 Tax=Chondrus crispus TaxID=2769 RepID=R7QC56_CHOCR|nr:unnamed protein product [Chondrus crispus]CDF34981.1 unnamed protein product [Chondrus crispus]|eukprot:XP_005714800.1 unnamed protein product [Chondrus crispus]